VRRRRPRGAGSGPLPRAPFDLIDELACYYDTTAEPNNEHFEVLVPGAIDYLALRQAVASALAATPRARGRMAAGHAFRCRYTWEFPPVTDVDPVSRTTWSDEDELAAARVRFLSSAPPLRTSPPVRLLLASGPAASCLILNAHHAAMDGTSCVELLRDIAGRYRVIAGEQAITTADTATVALPDSPLPDSAPPGSAPPGSAAPGGPPPHRPVRAARRAVLRRLAARVLVARIAPERSRGTRRDGFGLRLLLVPALPRLPGVTVNDMLVAALIATIGQWNAAHHRPPAPMRITVPVSVREPGLRGVAGNHTRIATIAVGPRTAADDPPRLLAAVSRQASALKRAGKQRASAGPLGLAPGWCPVGLKRLAVQFSLRAIGRIVCDTCMLTNLGNVTDPPWSGSQGRVRMAVSGPVRMPRGLSVGAMTADDQLQLAFRYRHALLDETAAARFVASYAATLDQLATQGGDTRGPAPGAAQDPRLPGRQGLAHVLRRRGSAVQPAPEARVPDRERDPGNAGRASRAGDQAGA
jgi:NRPS condensation-like uncharacterized protein